MDKEQVLSQLHFSFHALFLDSDGQDIWQCLQKPENIIRAETAAYLGKSPLDALTPELLKLNIFQHISANGIKLARVERFKQLTGSLLRIVMCVQLGYTLNKSKQKLKPSSTERPQIFTTVSTYSK